MWHVVCLLKQEKHKEACEQFVDNVRKRELTTLQLDYTYSRARWPEGLLHRRASKA